MNLENLSIEELIEIVGGSDDIFDDGSGKGCIPDIPGFPKLGFPRY